MILWQIAIYSMIILIFGVISSFAQVSFARWWMELIGSHPYIFLTNHYNFIRQMLTSRYWNGRIAQIMLNIFTHPRSMKSLTQGQRQSSCRQIARQRWPAWRCCWHWLLQNSGKRQRERWFHETNCKRLNKTKGLCGKGFEQVEEKDRNGISWDEWKDKFWFWRLQAK